MNEFRVTMPHTPGNLARVTRALADKGVSILGLSCHGLGEEGFAALLVDDEDAARSAFGGAGVSYEEVPAYIVHLDDTVGALADACTALGNSDVNIETTYLAKVDEEFSFVFTADSPRAAGLLGAE